MAKTKLLTAAVIGLLLMNAAIITYLFLQKNTGPPRTGEGEAARFLTEQLQLDAEQQEAFAKLRHKHHKAIRKVREEDRNLHDTYWILVKSDNPPRAQVDSIAALIGLNRQKTELITFEHFNQLRALCNDEQKKRFDNLIIDELRRMAPRPNQRPERPPPPR